MNIGYKQKAFTLLEVLVALAILTMGLGTVIKVAGGQASQLARYWPICLFSILMALQ